MDKELKYEEALKKLSEIVEKMESGELPLDEMVSYYQEGEALLKLCREQLNSAEGKLLKLKDDGSIENL